MRGIELPPKHTLVEADAGPAPMLQWIDIAALVVDDRYQRELKRENWRAIARIAGQFRWSRFSTVLVAPVEGGRFAIIDGQHRTHAALMCGMTAVPCQVVQMDLAEQASSFAAVNGLVTKVTLFQIYKASLAAGETWAVECHRICADAGCRLMTYHASADAKKPGEIYAISLVRGYGVKKLGRVVTYALKALRDSEGGAEPATWSSEVLKPLLAAVTDRPWLVQQKADLAGFLDRFDIWAAIDSAAEIAKQRRRMGAEDVKRMDIASAKIGEGLDIAFPQRMALPKRESVPA